MKYMIFLLCFFVNQYIICQDKKTLLTQELETHFSKSDLTGFSVAITSIDKVIYQRGFGLSDRSNNTPFNEKTTLNLGSVSKAIVGLALVKAIQAGHLTMDTKINDVLPFSIHHPKYPNDEILIRHLASHTSGLTDTKHYGKTYLAIDGFEYTEDVSSDYLSFLQSHKRISLKEFISNLFIKRGAWYKKKNFTKKRPGLEAGYANVNAALIGLIIEHVTNRSFEEFTREHIFQPLGMTNTSWDIQNIDQNTLATLYFPKSEIVPKYQLITYPDGGLLSNTRDLSLLLVEMIKAYEGHSTYLPIQYAQMLLPGDTDRDRAFWGMGLKSKNIGHGGSDPGVQTDLQFNADRKIGRIILTNVNAEDNEKLWRQYREIHDIIAKYEDQLR